MEYFLWTLIFLFGAALGSFVAVITDRYNTGLPFFKGRSFCFSCNTQLKNKDLIPIFSFLSLRGKCRHCRSKIPHQTFIIEILMGGLAVLAALKSGFISLPFSWLLATGYLLLTFIFANILLISFYDLKHFIIPDSFLISFFLLSLFYTLLLDASYLLPHLFSGLLLTLPFLLLFLASRGKWLGFGDVKYIAVLGFFLGLPGGVSTVILAFWIGAAFSIFSISLKKIGLLMNLPNFKNNLTMKSEIPFGPFLSIGIIISFYLNADLFHLQTLFNFF